MISVSNDFKNAMKAPVKVVGAQIAIQDGATYTSGGDLVKAEVQSSGYFFGVATKTLTFTLLGTSYSLVEKFADVTLKVQTDASNDTWESCDLGAFQIVEQKIDLEKGMSDFKAYDAVGIAGLKPYATGGLNFPCTVDNLAVQVASATNMSYNEGSLVNGTYTITEDLYSNISNLTYRDILAEVAGASASLASVSGVGSSLSFRNPSKTPLEALTYDNLKTFKLQPKYGEVNTVVLARTPQEDNVVAYPYGEATGTELSLPDAGESVKELSKITGTTQQVTTTGKNLFTSANIQSGFGTLSVKDDNEFTLSITKTSSSPTLFREVPFTLSPNTTYTLKALKSITGTTFNKTGGIRLNKENAWTDTWDSNGIMTFTTGNTGAIKFGIYLYHNAGTATGDVSVRWYQVQLEKSSSATSFEPFTDGASPNPTYPQPVDNTTGFSLLSITGKNMCPFTPNTNADTLKGLTVTFNAETGAIRVSGTATGTWSNISVSSEFYIPTGIYTISSDKVLNDFSTNLKFTATDGTNFERQIAKGKQAAVVTLTKPATKFYIYLGTITSGQVVDETFTLQFEKGDNATEYVLPKYHNLGLNLGKNLFNKNDVEVGGILQTNGTVDPQYTDARSSGFIPVLPNTLYKVSGRPHGWEVNGLYKADKTFIARWTGGSFVTPSDCYWVRLSCYSSDLSTAQLERTSATSYASFVPAYGKNLMTAKFESGTYNSSGEKSANANSYRSATMVEVKGNTKYIISRNGSGMAMNLCFYNSSRTFLSYLYVAAGASFTTPANCAFLTMSRSTSTEMSKIMLEEGTTISAFEPCVTGQVELGEIGEFSNFIYPSGDDWYIHQEIGKLVLDGTETYGWATLGNGQGAASGCKRFRFSDPTIGNIGNSKLSLKCNIFTGVVYNNNISTKNAISQWSDTHMLTMTTDSTTYSLADFKATLASEPIVAYYALDKTYNIKITNADLIAQLEAIKAAKLYGNGSHIDLLANQVAPTLTIDYWKSQDAPCEVKLANNEILDDDREQLAEPILDAVSGFGFYPFNATTEGHGWHEVGDCLELSQPALPADYQEVEYLQSSGTQYINTSVTFDKLSKIEIEFKPVGDISSSTIRGVFGMYNESYGCQAFMRSNGLGTRFGYTAGESATNFNASGWNNVVTSKGGVFFNGVRMYSGTALDLSTDATTTIPVFERASGEKSSIQVRKFKIWKADELAADLIPCRRKADNVAGMYDTVAETFFTNAGTGTFTVGADKSTPTTKSCNIVITDIKLTIDGGLKEELKGVAPTESTTNYALAGGIKKSIYNTEIKVDKQGQEITSIVSRQDEFEGQTLANFSQISQNINSVVTTIQTTGGGNLIHNSVGYKKNTDGTLASWTNVGTVASETSPESISYGALSGNQIDLGASSSITQEIAVDLTGSVYTLTFRAKKGATGIAKVSFYPKSSSSPSTDGFSVEMPNGTAVLWQEYSITSMTPLDTPMVVKVETNGSVTDFAITDLMLTVGDSRTPWVSASDEIMSKSVAIDSEGVKVSSNSNNDYVKLDELGLNGYSDAGGSLQNVFTVNRDLTEVAKLKSRQQIEMPPLKIVPINSSSNSGWGWVKI